NGNTSREQAEAEGQAPADAGGVCEVRRLRPEGVGITGQKRGGTTADARPGPPCLSAGSPDQLEIRASASWPCPGLSRRGRSRSCGLFLPGQSKGFPAAAVVVVRPWHGLRPEQGVAARDQRAVEGL